VSGEQAPDANADPRLNVDTDRLHLILTPVELDMSWMRCARLATLSWPSASTLSYATQAMARAVSDTPESDASDQELKQTRRDPPPIDGRCNRCGWQGKVYRGRYGGHRCSVCFALQWGWMPRGDN
jgi:hypothetical protein